MSVELCCQSRQERSGEVSLWHRRRQLQRPWGLWSCAALRSRSSAVMSVARSDAARATPPSHCRSIRRSTGAVVGACGDDGQRSRATALRDRRVARCVGRAAHAAPVVLPRLRRVGRWLGRAGGAVVDLGQDRGRPRLSARHDLAAGHVPGRVGLGGYQRAAGPTARLADPLGTRLVGLFVAGLALQNVWGWVGPVLAGIVAVPVVIVGGRRYDAAVRADERRRA